MMLVCSCLIQGKISGIISIRLDEMGLLEFVNGLEHGSKPADDKSAAPFLIKPEMGTLSKLAAAVK